MRSRSLGHPISPDQVDKIPACGRCTRQRRCVTNKGHLGGRGAHCDCARRIRIGERSRRYIRADSFLDQVILPGLNNPADRGNLPVGSTGRSILYGPAGEAHRRFATIEKLNEVVPEWCTGIPAASVNLTDNNIRRALGKDQCGSYEQEQGPTHLYSMACQRFGELNIVSPDRVGFFSREFPRGGVEALGILGRRIPTVRILHNYWTATTLATPAQKIRP